MAIELEKIIPGDGAQTAADKIYNNDNKVLGVADEALTTANEAKELAQDKGPVNSLETSKNGGYTYKVPNDNLLNGGVDYTTGLLVSETEYKSVDVTINGDPREFELLGRQTTKSMGFACLNSSGSPIPYNAFTGATSGTGLYKGLLNGKFKTIIGTTKIRFTVFSSYDSGDITSQTGSVYIKDLSTGDITVIGINGSDIAARYIVNKNGETVEATSMGESTAPVVLGSVVIGGGAEYPTISSTDGTAGLKDAIAQIAKGGTVFLKNAKYIMSKSVGVQARTVRIKGEVWAYNNDPTGIFPSDTGVNIWLQSEVITCFHFTGNTYQSGCLLEEFGVQGSATHANIQGLLDFASPRGNTGILIEGTRLDQSVFRRLNFCGLAAGVSVNGVSSLDACTFKEINADGNNFGLLFKPSGMVYCIVKDCVLADCPGSGIYVTKHENVAQISVERNFFGNLKIVRTGGGFTSTQAAVMKKCGAYFNMDKGYITNSDIHESGIWWDHSGEGGGRVVRTDVDTKGLILEGSDNTIAVCDFMGNKNTPLEIIGNNNNVSSCSFREEKAIYLKGNYNNISNCNIMTNGDTSLIIEGNYNVINGNVINKKIQVKGSNNVIYNSGSATVEIISGSNNKLIGFD